MTFDPFSTAQQPASDQSPVPAPATQPVSNPFVTPEDDEDEIHFDLTGDGGVPMAQPSPPMAEPELRVELTPITSPSSVTNPAPTFSAPWEMPAPAAPMAPPSNPFSLDLSATPAPVPQAPAPTAAGLVGLFDRLLNMIEEETREFETSQKKHQANIANEQRLIEEETKAFGAKKADILKGIEDLKKRLAA